MAPTAQSTAFILVPGGFSPGKVYHRVAQRLTELGYVVEEFDHPTIVSDPKEAYAASFDDDVSHLRTTIVKHLDAGTNVVVAANSYGGFVATEAAKGLSRGERKDAGVESDVALTHLVYLASMIAPTGKSIRELVGQHLPPPAHPDDKFLAPPPAEIAGSVFYNDLGETEQKRYGEQLMHHSIEALSGIITHAGYFYIPTTVVLAENDKTIPLQVQRENLDSVIGGQTHDIRMLSINTDHSPMVSHPEKVVEILTELTG